MSTSKTPIVYTQLMYRGMVMLLRKYNDGVLQFSREQATKGPGAILLDYSDVASLVDGNISELKWADIPTLRQQCHKDVQWSTYENLDFSKQFTLVARCVDIDGNVHWLTTAHEDDGGPCDTAHFELYVDKVTNGVCGSCLRKVGRYQVCRKCGKKIYSCDAACRRDFDPHHALVCRR